MKKNRKLKNLMLFASSGAIVCTGSPAFANDLDQPVQRSGTYKVEEKVEIRTDSDLNRSGAQFNGQIMDESAGAERSYRHSSTVPLASFGAVHKASDLIGMEVRNHQNEKLGDIRDVMIDLDSGRIPFAILSSDVGNRLVALPPTALSMSGRNNRVVLDMDRERLRSAPSFERNRWPDMSDQQWSSDVYRFYGVEPYRHSSFQGTRPYYHRETYTERTVTEPAGARTYYSQRLRGTENPDLGEVQGITRLDDISGNRTRGGAVDLQPFAHRNEGPIGTTTQWEHSEKMGRGAHVRTDERMRHERSARMHRMGRYHRASDLIGMNIRNSQGQTVGEIQDVVLDLNSGHVAYAVVDADPFLNTRGEFVAVPPSLFRTSSDTRTLTLNADRQLLMNAPRLEMDRWSQASNEQFVSRVYRHYGQQPYWQAQGFRQGTQFREPSGAEYNQNYQYQEHEYRNDRSFQQNQPAQPGPGFQEDSSSFQQEQKFSDPAGAELQSEEPERSVSDPEISEPSGAELESEPEAQSQSSATLETRESQASAPSAGFEPQTEQEYRSEIQVEEPAGAQPDAQSQAQSDTAGAQLQAPSSAELEPEISVHAEQQSGQQVQDPAGAERPSTEEYPVPTRTRGAEVSEPAGADTTTVTEPAGADTHAQQVRDAAGAAPTKLDQSQKLTQQVQTALKSDASLGAQNIQVTTEDGKIVLRGTVKSETEKQQIEQRVQDVLLQNRIQVEDSGQLDPGTQSQP